MVHVRVKSTRYQIYLDILPLFPKNFIEVSQAWPQLWPQRLSKVWSNNYGSIDYAFAYLTSSPFDVDNNRKRNSYLKAFLLQKHFFCDLQNSEEYNDQMSDVETMAFIKLSL